MDGGGPKRLEVIPRRTCLNVFLNQPLNMVLLRILDGKTGSTFFKIFKFLSMAFEG